MSYIENPKTKGSGIVCCIPQKGECPVGCPDCFFQSGRSFLEPLEKNLPNMPHAVLVKDRVVRVNDGNDSNHQRELVMASVAKYPQKFYNTSHAGDLEKFDAPVVLTVNPSVGTDHIFNDIWDPPKNLMFVRARVNTWNLELIDKIVEHYSALEIPVVLTFMAYYEAVIPDGHKDNYTYRKRTLNSYWVITPEAWDKVMARYYGNTWVYSCGKTANDFACHRCGNCLREYFYTMEKMKAV